MGRPRREIPEAARAEVVRLWRRGKGRRSIARALTRLGHHVSDGSVRSLLEAKGMTRSRKPAPSWDTPAPRALWPDDWGKLEPGPYTCDDHLAHTAGERSVDRLARELGRTKRAVQLRLVCLGRHMPELRQTLTLSQVERLTGRVAPTLLGAIRRGELRAHQSDGAWRVWPSDLRTWLLGDLDRLDLDRVGEPEEHGDIAHARREILGLIGELWGTTGETARKAEQRKRRANTPPGALGPSAR